MARPSFQEQRQLLVDCKTPSFTLSARCKKLQARYSCPTCNVPYCSLECFRGEEHRDCSEGFYRSIIEEDIRSAPDKTNEEKRGMMEILQRMADPNNFLGQPVEDVDGLEDGEENSALKLANLDIDSADTDALWDALSPAQRLEFTKAMEDPNSSLARQLLDSLEIQDNAQSDSQWWEDHEQVASDTSSAVGSVPSLIQVPEPLSVASQSEWSTKPTPLLYNVVSVCLAYAYCIRTLQIRSFSDAEPQDAQTSRQLMSQAVPFLTDRKSVTRLENVDTSIAYVQSRLKDLVHKLLPDIALFFRMSVVVEVSSGPAASNTPPSPCWRLLACLGDIATLYHSSPKASITDKATIHKLTFYAAHVAAAPTAQLRRISSELERRSSSFEEDGSFAGYHTPIVVPPDLQFPRGRRGDPGPVDAIAHIEEIK